jgi:hypothetical protein
MDILSPGHSVAHCPSKNTWDVVTIGSGSGGNWGVDAGVDVGVGVGVCVDAIDLIASETPLMALSSLSQLALGIETLSEVCAAQ